MNRGALNRPRESDEADWQAGSRVQEEPQPRLVLRPLVVGFRMSLLDVTLNSRDEQQPCEKVSNTDGDEGKTDLNGAEFPLPVHEAKGLDEHEDEGIRETREKRENQDNRLGEEHLEGADPGVHDLLGREPVGERNKLVGAPDVGVALFAFSLGDLVHHDGGTGLGHGEEVDGLDDDAEDELDPDGPSIKQQC